MFMKRFYLLIRKYDFLPKEQVLKYSTNHNLIKGFKLLSGFTCRPRISTKNNILQGTQKT